MAIIARYRDRAEAFRRLVGILDDELRIITPTEQATAEDRDNAGETDVGDSEARYQLTHDYLVPAVRQWLTRKQKETYRGRAELRLEDRAALWKAYPENRRLPSWWEYLNIRPLTHQDRWTGPQRKMMDRAGWVHMIRAATLVAIIAVVAWAGYQMLQCIECPCKSGGRNRS